MKSLCLAIAAILSISLQTSADEIVVQCQRDQASGTCASRTLSAMQKIGCSPIAASVQCRDAATDPLIDPSAIDSVAGKDFCSVQSACVEPTYGNFGQVTCELGQTKRDLKSEDVGLSLTTSVGLFGRFVTTVCR